jgi:hypothetical protein
MSTLKISDQELSRLTEKAFALAMDYWSSLEDLPAYPMTSGKETAECFARSWTEEGARPRRPR